MAAPRRDAAIKREFRLPATSAATAAAVSTAAAAAAAAAVTTAAAAAATTTAIFTRSGLVDLQVATLEILSVESLDGVHHRALGVHCNKRESARASAFPIGRDEHFGHFTVLPEQRPEIIFTSLEGDIPHIHFHRFNWFARIPVNLQTVPGYRVSDHH
jgi:hypothetical protein